MAGEVSASQLYRYILKNREVVDGRLMCRAAIFPYLEGCGVTNPKSARTSLVKELTRQGRVLRENPRSRRLLILDA